MPSDAEITNYDSIAEQFIVHAARVESWNNMYERPNTIARLPELTGKSVLDLGCSTGFYVDYVLEHGAAVTGVDASRLLIDKLMQRIKNPIAAFYCADICRPMPFLESGSFDVAIVSLVLDYIRDWSVLLTEMHRVLKKGGRVVISIGHPFSEYLYLIRQNRPESYHAFKMLEDTWGRDGPTPFKVYYYIRPLNEVLRPIIQSEFKIISIDEPLPNEECKRIDPESYQRLMTQPGFLFIVLEK
jgi:SAM-dependent methyltransferase